MIREPEARINEVADQIANEGMIVRASQVREGAIEISRQRHEIERLRSLADSMGEDNQRLAIEIERLTAERKNCPPASESEYVRRLEDEIERLKADLSSVHDLLVSERGVYHETQWRQLEEARAEIERLKEQFASLQASSGYEASIMQLEVERLQALLRRHQVAAWCEEDSDLAIETRAALEAKS